GPTRDWVVAVGRYRDHDPAPRFNLLDIVDHLVVDAVLDRDRDDWHVLVDQRDRTVFHLTGRVTFGVDVGELFQFERAFQGDRELDAAAEIQEVTLAMEPLGQSFVRQRPGQDVGNA